MALDFVLTLPNINHITEAVRARGKGSYLVKIDVSRALKHVPIDPKDINYLGLHWNGYFIEKTLCFGFKRVPKSFKDSRRLSALLWLRKTMKL